MSEVISINDLPSEILTKILVYLDHRSLGNATLTCKHWNEIIEFSCRWRIFMRLSDKHLPQFLRTTNRRICEITIIGLMYTNLKEMLDILRRHGSNVSKLTLSHALLKNTDDVDEIVDCMPNLGHVKFFNVRTAYIASSSTDSLPEFAKLKILEAANCSRDIIRCFKRSPNLKEFRQLDDVDETTIRHTTTLEFLQSHTQLKSLVLYDICNKSALLQPGIITNDSVKCQLSQLYLINFCGDLSQQCCNNLLEFLKMQAKSVEILKLGLETPTSVYEIVFSKFENLKSLQLPIYEIARDKQLLKRLELNESITQLVLMRDSSKEEQMESQCIKEFIRCVPNVTDLTLNHHFNKEILEIIANNLTDLRRLIFNACFKKEYSGIRFPYLKTFRFLDFDHEFDWEEFTKLNPHITELLIVGRLQWDQWDKDFLSKLFEILRKNLKMHIDKIISSNVKSAVEEYLMCGLPSLYFNDAKSW